jgi:hypothetical protein
MGLMQCGVLQLGGHLFSFNDVLDKLMNINVDRVFES